jgi:ADP-ribose pyrophosphatase YjhB (NUDIX family)
MAEVVVTQFQLDISQYEANLVKATKGMEGYDKATNEADAGTKELEGELGSASQKFKVLDGATKQASKGMKEVGKDAGAAGSAIGMVKDKVNEAVPALGRVGGAVKALGLIFKSAFGPIVLLVGLVVGAIVGLGKAFLSTERGADALQKVTTIVTTVLDRLLGIAQRVSFVLVDAFKNPKQAVADLWEAIKQNLVTRLDGLVDQFKAFGEVVAGVFTLDFDRVKAGVLDFGESTVQAITGVDDAIGKAGRAFERFGAEIASAAKEGDRIFEIGEELEALAIRRAKEEARLNRTISEQLAIARDVNATSDARKAAAEQAIAAQNQLAGLSLKENALLIERIKLQQKQSDVGFEGQLELAKLTAAQDQIEADRLDAGRRARAIIAGVDAENAAAEIERQKKLAEADAERQKLRIETQQEVNDRLDELRQERELAGLSETDRAIEEAKIQAAKEVETAGALYDNLEKLAAGNAQQIVDIRAQQAENIALIEQGLVEKITAIQAEADQTQTEKQKADAEKLKEEEAQRLAIVQDAATQVEGVLTGLADGSIKTAEDTSKALLGIALEAAEKQALIAAFNALGIEAGTKGVAGIATGLLIGALIKSAFAALRSQLAGSFYEGGIVGKDGGTKMHSGRDGYIANVHKGEMIMPTDKTNRYLPYLEMMRDGKFEKFLNTTAQLNGYSAKATTSTATPSFNDRRLVGTMAGVGSLREQRKQTELLAMVAQGLNRGRNARYTA